MRGQGKIGTLAIWIIAMYLVVQCWIFFYSLENASTTELWIFEPKETTNELGVPLHERLFHAPQTKNCTIPDDWLYPLCRYKLKWMVKMWSSDRKCYVDRHGIDPRDDCSLLIFFSEVEKWCPLLPWRKHLYSSGNAQHSIELATVREDLGELFKKMNHSKYRWMRDRITRLWPDWKLAAKQLEKEKSSFRNRRVKNIYFYMGAFAYHKNWLEGAYSGKPLGEMVQWSDLIASSYILGHNITLSAELEFINRTLVETPDNTCAIRMNRKPFDLLYTDYSGTHGLQDALGPMASQYRCSLRILDSFGTDAEFNYAEYPSDGADFGGLDIHLRQILTMFPHSPDNLFLGFAIDKAVSMETSQVTSPKHLTKPGDKPIGLLYAKDAWFLSGRRNYIDTLSKYFQIHGTIGNETKQQQRDVQDYMPDYVINHGVMKAGDYQHLLRRSKIFIGVGEPYEGPAPLEAISQGCVFINLKLDPPLSRENSAFFKGKPTSRQLTSQNPYMETFIGKPYVYTIDVNNLELVESTVKEILSSEAVKPYLPYEWTPKGMLERVNIFAEKMDFCEHGEQWPPLKEMQLVLGSNGNSCKEACGKRGFLCEPSFFNYINSVEEFNKLGVSCGKQVKDETLHAPSYNPADQSCTFQAMSLLFSCVAKDPARRRLCPCRDYQPQQVAFCKNCD